MPRFASISMATLTALAFTFVGGASVAHASHFRGGNMFATTANTTGPPTTYGTIDIELVALSLTSVDPVGNIIPLPELSSGQTAQVDSFFDVITDLTFGGQTFTIDSFFDIEIEVSPNNSTGSWDTEILAMQLTGQIPGGPTIVLRESPSLPSQGNISVFDGPGGDFQVDSFFDVFTEISVDGGPWVPADGSTHLILDGPVVPEPSSVVLAVIALVGLLSHGRRRRRA